jgi:HlyD family secretion protein
VERQVEQAQLALETTRQQLTQVQRGALPDEIDRERAELQRRRSARELAEQDLARALQLFEKRVLARADLDRARSTLDQARASEQSEEHNLQVLLQQPRVEDLRVAEARVRESEATLRLWQEQLRKRTIVSPADGLLLKRKVEPGQSVIPGSSLLVLSMMDKTEVYVETDENNLRKLQTGQKAVVVAPSFPDRPFQAVLTQINPDVDHARGVVGLRLRPESLPDFARPDMTLDVNIEVARIRDALSVPSTALLERDGKAYVLEVRGDLVVSAPVIVLGKGESRIAVSEIRPDALIVTRAAETKAGAVVRPKEVRP